MTEMRWQAVAIIMAMAVSTAATQAGAPAPDAAVRMNAKEAGVRYGQALGAALICYGLRVTPAADALRQEYQGPDLAAFQAEAGKVLDAWREASSCRKAGDPNVCRLIYEWSCRDAVREIGPDGTKARGLVEAKH